MADPLTLSVTITAAIAAMASAVATWMTWRAEQQSADAAKASVSRDKFELARSLHVDLTTGDVAAARNLLGTVAHADHPQRVLKKDHERYRQAWFTELWCFERINNALCMFDKLGADARDAEIFLLDLIAVQTSFLNEEATTVRKVLVDAGANLDDGQSRGALIDVIKRLHDEGLCKCIKQQPDLPVRLPCLGVWATN